MTQKSNFLALLPASQESQSVSRVHLPTYLDTLISGGRVAEVFQVFVSGCRVCLVSVGLHGRLLYDHLVAIETEERVSLQNGYISCAGVLTCLMN